MMRKLAAWITGLLAFVFIAADQTGLATAEMVGEVAGFRMEPGRSERSGHFQVTAYVQRVQDLYAYDLGFTYDRLRLKLVKAESGMTGFTVPVNSKGSQIRLAHTMIGAVSGKSGDVELATLSFERIRGGNAGVTWERAKLVDSALSSKAYAPDNRMLWEDTVKRAAFPDLAGHWAEAAVREGEELGFADGYEDGSFRPQREVTRAEFTSLLVRALGLPKNVEHASHPFRDVSGEDWYASDVAAAYAAKLVDGVNADRFAPEADISREQMAVLLARAYVSTLEKLGCAYPCADFATVNAMSERRREPVILVQTGSSVSADTASERFVDAADISEWALEGVNKALGLGLMQGKGEWRLDPIDTTNRGEAVQAVLNLLKAE